MAKKQKTGKKAAKAVSKLQKAASKLQKAANAASKLLKTSKSPAVKKGAASKKPPKKR